MANAKIKNVTWSGIQRYHENLNQWYTDIIFRLKELETTHVADVVIQSGFVEYETGSEIKCYKNCNVVTLTGVLKNTSRISLRETKKMFEIPEGYIPSSNLFLVCDCEDLGHKYILKIATDGFAYFTECRSQLGNASCDANTKLPITITYVVE